MFIKVTGLASLFTILEADMFQPGSIVAEEPDPSPTRYLPHSSKGDSG
jgi:hypothetical protein